MVLLLLRFDPDGRIRLEWIFAKSANIHESRMRPSGSKRSTNNPYIIYISDLYHSNDMLLYYKSHFNGALFCFLTSFQLCALILVILRHVLLADLGCVYNKEEDTDTIPEIK